MNAENNSAKATHPARGRHQTFTIALHWITALLVFAQVALAVFHDRASDAEIRRWALAAHRSLGVVIWLLVLGRLAWRLLGMRLVPFPLSMPKWHQWSARLSEWALYGLLLEQPLAGMAATVLRGQPFNLIGITVPSLMAPDRPWAAAAQQLHSLGAYALVSLVMVHAGAAILHRVIADDGVLDSMLPLRRKRNGAPVPSDSQGVITVLAPTVADGAPGSRE
jgi:cytochrome b561